jgi:hypothetical protein
MSGPAALPFTSFNGSSTVVYNCSSRPQIEPFSAIECKTSDVCQSAVHSRRSFGSPDINSLWASKIWWPISQKNVNILYFAVQHLVFTEFSPNSVEPVKGNHITHESAHQDVESAQVQS